MNIRKAIKWVFFWMAMSIIFNAGIYLFLGGEKALQFLGGYVIELSLSMDNLFIFLLIFQAFKIHAKSQRRVLNYGIFGAIVLRFIFTMLGVTVVNKFHWVLYIFGAILLISGISMMLKKKTSNDFKDSTILKVLNKIIPITNELHGEKFFVRINKVIFATPLFAILGLRSLYFVLAKLHDSFEFVKYGIAVILVFTGMKLLLLMFSIEINIIISLTIIFSILALSIVFSIIFSGNQSNYN